MSTYLRYNLMCEHTGNYNEENNQSYVKIVKVVNFLDSLIFLKSPIYYNEPISHNLL